MIHLKAHNLLFIVLGGLFLVIGIVGIFLPLLPTTPFLLLTAICFDRGSPHFHRWLLNHKIFGPPISEWQRKHVIRTKFKILATVMILGASVFVLPSERIPLAGKAAYLGIISCVLVFLWTRKSR